MTSSEDLENYYTQWLDIPPERLPPNHYALLGVEDFEADSEVIESAAKSRAAYLHEIAAGPQRKAVQEMLGKVAIARRCLANSESKAEYDESLRQPTAVEPETVPKAEPTTQANSQSSLASNSEGTREASRPSKTSASPVLVKAPRRKKTSAWKFHAMSAGGLLLIVGIIFFVNRNGGGRRAAEADDSALRQKRRSIASLRAARRPRHDPAK